ncbi:MAG: hypothetical protein RL641_38 [Candidatus Parcubacteria bacterium]
MKIPTKKLKNGFEMPVYGLGTWQMGGRKDHDPANDDMADIEAIKTSINNGVLHIDTAESYADGYTERLVAKAIKDFDRSAIFLVSKVHADNQTFEGIIQACKSSLTRLEVDYLDLYLLHRHNANIPLHETMRGLDKLITDGVVKNIGVCNFTKEALEEAQSYTKNKIVCNQVHYNFIFREPERTGLLKYCQENDVFLSAWRPIQKGAILEDTPEILKEMCEKYNKTPAQIAINWLISQENVITLSKTRNVSHLQENLGAIGWTMSDEDIDKIREKYPVQIDISDAVPLG